jgi:hypothetical protein
MTSEGASADSSDAAAKVHRLQGAGPLSQTLGDRRDVLAEALRRLDEERRSPEERRSHAAADGER